MTVKELIEKLQQYDSKLKVKVENDGFYFNLGDTITEETIDGDRVITLN
jgi:hypothetical protein